MLGFFLNSSAPVTAIVVSTCLAFNILGAILPHLVEILAVTFIIGVSYGLYDARRYPRVVYVDPATAPPPPRGLLANMRISTGTLILIGWSTHVLLLYYRGIFYQTIIDLSYDLDHHDWRDAIWTYAWGVILPPVLSFVDSPRSFLDRLQILQSAPLLVGNADDGNDSDGSDITDSTTQTDQGDAHAPRNEAHTHDRPTFSLFSMVESFYQGIVPVYYRPRDDPNATRRLDSIITMLQLSQASQDQLRIQLDVLSQHSQTSQDQQKLQVDALNRQVQQHADSMIADSAQRSQQLDALSQQLQQLDAARVDDRAALQSFLDVKLSDLSRRIRFQTGQAGQPTILSSQSAIDRSRYLEGLVAARTNTVDATPTAISPGVQQILGDISTSSEKPRAFVVTNTQSDSQPDVAPAPAPAPAARNLTEPILIATTNNQIDQPVALPIDRTNRADHTDRDFDNVLPPSTNGIPPPATNDSPAPRPSAPSPTSTAHDDDSSSDESSSIVIQTEPEDISPTFVNTVSSVAPAPASHIESQPEITNTTREIGSTGNGQSATIQDHTDIFELKDAHGFDLKVESDDMYGSSAINLVAVNESDRPFNNPPIFVQEPGIDDYAAQQQTIVLNPNTDSGDDQHDNMQGNPYNSTFNMQPDSMDYTQTNATILPEDTIMNDSHFDDIVVQDEARDAEMNALVDTMEDQVHHYGAVVEEDEMDFERHDHRTTDIEVPTPFDRSNSSSGSQVFNAEISNSNIYPNLGTVAPDLDNTSNPEPEAPIDTGVVENPDSSSQSIDSQPESSDDDMQDSARSEGSDPDVNPIGYGTYVNPMGSNVVQSPQVGTPFRPGSQMPQSSMGIRNQPIDNPSAMFTSPVSPAYDLQSTSSTNLPSTSAYTIVGSPLWNTPEPNSQVRIGPVSPFVALYELTQARALPQPNPVRPASMIPLPGFNNPSPLFFPRPSSISSFQSPPAAAAVSIDPPSAQINTQQLSTGNTDRFNDNGRSIAEMIAARRDVIVDIRRLWFNAVPCPHHNVTHQEGIDQWVNMCNALDIFLNTQEERHSNLDEDEDVDAIRADLQGDRFIDLPRRTRLESGGWYEFDETKLTCSPECTSITLDDCQREFDSCEREYRKKQNVANGYRECSNHPHTEDADEILIAIFDLVSLYRGFQHRLRDERQDYNSLLDDITRFKTRIGSINTSDIEDPHDEDCTFKSDDKSSSQRQRQPPAPAPAPAPAPSTLMPPPPRPARAIAAEAATSANIAAGLEAAVLATTEASTQTRARPPGIPVFHTQEEIARRPRARLPGRRSQPSTPITPSTPVTPGIPPLAQPPVLPQTPSRPTSIPGPTTARQIRSRQVTKLQRGTHSPEDADAESPVRQRDP